MRGECIGSFDFIRNIHNSFARKMDMLNADLFLSNDASAKRVKSKNQIKATVDDDQAGFHFIAFVPIGGSVWKLDGLERQPVELGNYKGDWMSLARPTIEERMQQYEDDQIRFSLISLCKSPLLSIPEELTVNIRTIQAVEARLQSIKPDWKEFVEGESSDGLLRGPDDNFGVSVALLGSARDLPKPTLTKISNPGMSPESLFDMHMTLGAAQAKLRASFIEETVESERNNERASGRRHDLSPLIYKWVSLLAEKDALKNLVEVSGA